MEKNNEYEKMPKAFSQLGLTEQEVSKVNKLYWVVTEKVHGANFSFVYENRQLHYAKRKAYLDWNDDFFGFQQVAERLEDQLLQLFEQLSLQLTADKYIVYGELFGGEYPHPEVESTPNVFAIQTGVYYAPNIDFCAFDIAYEMEGKKHYLDYDLAIALFEASKILYAKVLFEGKLNEVMQFNTRINSTIPNALNLPALATNTIEGIVIKPMNHSGIDGLSKRPILKIKNTEFDEDEKFHQAAKWSFVPNSSTKSEELSFVVEELAAYINHNRIQSAVSKIGAIDKENPERIAAIRTEVQEDAFVDFNANNSNLLTELTPEQHTWIKNRVLAIIDRQLIKQ